VGGKRRYSKTGLVLVMVMVVCLLLVLAVIPGGIGDDGKDSDLDDKNTPGIKTVIEEGTPVMIFDKRESTRKLMQAFDDDEIAAVKIIYDRSGLNDEFKSSAPEDIRKVYKALKNVVVVDETNLSANNENYRITFLLNDGTASIFDFKGSNIFSCDGIDYEIVNAEDLWQTFREVIF
jgi:hypothetical protein